jgi:CheY-like chemotaxis protein
MTLPEQCPIVVADDDPAILEMVSDALSFEGYPIATATNGQEALAVIERIRASDPECPPLMLLDMRMPQMNGWDVAAALRDRAIDLPIVVMTAAVDAARWAAEVHAAGVLPKPFDLDHLLAEVQRVLAGRWPGFSAP